MSTAQQITSPEPYESIPVELRAWHQWIVWSWGDEPNKQGRLPKEPQHARSGRQKIDAHDERMHASFDEAVEAYQRGECAGIGFVFTARDPFCGVDLDGSLDEHGHLKPWAREIVTRLQTYTEVSPSGTGVKLFLKARKPGDRCKETLSPTEKIEAYDTKRFFTVTGQHLPGTPTIIADQQEELATWYAEVFAKPAKETKSHDNIISLPLDLDDEHLIEIALSARNGAKFRRLFVDGCQSPGGNAQVVW